MSETNIEWTQRPGTKGETWNPVVGCTPVSPGCLNCYAATMARRLEAMGRPEYAPRERDIVDCPGCGNKGEDGCCTCEHTGKVKASVLGLPPDTIRIAEVRGGRAVFTGEVRTLADRLSIPLSWKKPRTVFVNSMSDLFHEAVPFEFIDRVFAVMALTPQHTYQILTKRPERMAEYFGEASDGMSVRLAVAARDIIGRSRLATWVVGRVEQAVDFFDDSNGVLPNVWLGTSVEDQKTADQRIPHLLKCPAAVRFLSCEPLLGLIDFWQSVKGVWNAEMARRASRLDPNQYGIDWVIVGGESGPDARPCNIEHVRSVVRQCADAGVPCFVKQLGKCLVCGCGGDVGSWAGHHGHSRAACATCGLVLPFRSPKGGNIDDWPEDLRVRAWPTTNLREFC